MLILFWAVIAILAAIGEMLTLDLFLALVSVAAVFTALFALLLPVELQVVVFAALSAGGIAFTRPAIKHMLGVGRMLEISGATRQSSVVGRRGIVTRVIDGAGGQIRIGQGEFWTARAFDPSETIPVGTSVEVLLVEGIAAIVEATPSTTALDLGPAKVNAFSEKGKESC